MPSISVRQLDKQTIDRLRVRAARRGISMEEEIRQILKRATAAPANVSEVFRKHFGSTGGVELQEMEHDPHEAPDLG